MNRISTFITYTINTYRTLIAYYTWCIKQNDYCPLNDQYLADFIIVRYLFTILLLLLLLISPLLIDIILLTDITIRINLLRY